VSPAPGTQAEAYVRAVLRARARELAKPPVVEDESVRLVEIVEFTLGPEHYAFPSSAVREVFNLTEITPLPSLPPFVLGVTNVRGHIISVIDIRRFLEFGDQGLSNLNRAIILAGEGMELAVLADRVVGVYASDSNRWQLTMPTLVGKREAFLGGVTRERVVVLDAEKLLKSRDLLVGAE
jgi:purine-binding chemotaxis protein CheW